ncbi:MAG TPA: shikimate dehydrogenase [Allosphingosinicella sp.]
MGRPYAEVIGDPIGHSLSPAIHNFWLGALGLAGDYRAARVPAGGLAAYVREKGRDPFWRGCNVAAPLKREAAALLGDPTGVCGWLGAVNCIFHSPLAPLPANTDVAGVGEALRGVDVKGGRICLIGSGGAARAALCWLVGQGAAEVTILSREAGKAEALARLVPTDGRTSLAPGAYERAGQALAGAALVVHATPMGMTGGPPVRPELAEAVAETAGPGTTFFDMVYAPVETALLGIARDKGAACIDGLSMLIGQAAPAFTLFFGAQPPRERDPELRTILTP